jgi:hypothetical protein
MKGKTMRLRLSVIFYCFIFMGTASIGSDVVTAQEKGNYWTPDTTDPFNDVNVPFTDGLSMWIIRQKLTLKGYQAFIKTDAPAKEGVSSPQGNARIDLYLPLVINENFSSMVGGQHYTSRIITDVHEMDMGLIHDWLWLVGSYEMDSWKFILGAEYSINTNRNSYFSKRGDALMPYFVSGYAFSNTWQLIGLCGYRRISMVDEEQTTPLIGVQLRYQPANTCKLVVGAPVLFGSDWAVNEKFHLGCKALFTGKFSVEAFVTFYPRENFYTGLHYDGTNNKSANSYFYNETYLHGTEQIIYNNLTQFCHSLSLDFGFKLSEDVAFTLSGGYRLGDKVGLYNNTNHKLDIDGKDEFFISAAVQYLKYFDW